MDRMTPAKLDEMELAEEQRLEMGGWERVTTIHWRCPRTGAVLLRRDASGFEDEYQNKRAAGKVP